MATDWLRPCFRGILLRMSGKFWFDTRNRWYFPIEKHERKEAVKYVGKNNGSSIWDNLSSHFFFCNVDGSGKSLKLLCDVWKEVIFRMQKIVRVLSRDCLGDRWRWCYFWRMQVACRRVQKNWIVYFYRVIAISSYRWSFEVLAFL